MIIDMSMLWETPEESKRLTQLHKELTQMEQEGYDDKNRDAWEKLKDRKEIEVKAIENTIKRRYLDGITSHEALRDAREVLKNLSKEDYRNDVKVLAHIFGSIVDKIPEQDFLGIRTRECPEGALSFIQGAVELQNQKITESGNEELKKILDAAITAKMEEWFPAIQLPAVDSLPAFLFTMPNGEPIFFTSRLINGAKGKRTPRQSISNRHEKMDIQVLNRDGKSAIRFVRTVTEGNKVKSRIGVEVNELILRKNKGFLKIFYFLLSQMARNDFPPELIIPYQWFVDVGMYSAKSSVKRALTMFKDQIVDIRMSGEIRRGKSITEASAGVMFYNCEVGPTSVRILSNQEFNWDFICGYFTVFPAFSFQLSEDAFSLICYICYLARQNASKATEDGLTFTINMNSIADYLGLPPVDAVKNRKYKQYIIDPIEKAIEEIKGKTATDPACTDGAFTLTPHTPETKDINEWLKGYLEVTLKRDFTESFLEIAKKADKKKAAYLKAKQEEAGKIAARKEAATLETKAKGQKKAEK